MSKEDKLSSYRKFFDKLEKVRGPSLLSWEFKDYVLSFLFYRWMSEDFVKWIEGKANTGAVSIEYEKTNDDTNWIKNGMINLTREKGYFIKPSNLFSRVLEKLKNNEDISKTLQEAFRDIEESTQTFGSQKAYENIEGLLTSVKWNNSKLGENSFQRNKKISDLLRVISEMDFSREDGNSEIFEEMYEYLIGKYAERSGISGSDFYTPPGISNLLVRLVISEKREIKKIYDPACGFGYLLLKFLKLLNKKNTKIFGQELNSEMYQLCKMNMYLSGLNFNDFEFGLGDTLIEDLFPNLKFDAIVSHPSFSKPWKGKDDVSLFSDKRFIEAGALAPKDCADMAFIQHSMWHLNDKGIAAIICAPGICYRENEQKIREWLVDKNFIDSIISLPENLFFDTTIRSNIIILKKDTNKDKNILFIDASTIFSKGKSKRQLEEKDIKEIVDYYRNRTNIKNYSYLASLNEVKERNYDLSVNSYVVIENDKSDDPDFIKKINQDIEETSVKISELRRQIDSFIKDFEFCHQQ